MLNKSCFPFGNYYFIIFLESFPLLSPKYEEAEGIAINCDYESALKKGNEYFTDWTEEFNSTGYMGKYDYEIESCKLVYVPIFDDEDYVKHFSATSQFSRDLKLCRKRNYDLDFLYSVVDILRIPAPLP